LKPATLPHRLLTLLRWLIPLGLIALLLRQLDWNAILPLLAQVAWTQMLLAALVYLLAQVVIAVRWQTLLRVQEVNLPFLRLLGLVMVGTFVSNFLPTTIGGDLVKMAAVANGQPRRAVAVASVLADRLFNMAGMVFWLPLAFSLTVQTPLLETGTTAGSVLTRMPFLNGIGSRLKRLFEAGRPWFVSPKVIVWSLLLSWLSIGLSFASFWIVTLALGISISFWQASGIAALTYFVALLPRSISGLGLQEASLTGLLVSQGATYESALAAALLIRLVTMAVSLLGGVRLLFWRGLLTEAASQSGQIQSDLNKPG
jgi:glycosyltransferase 2 family protein